MRKLTLTITTVLAFAVPASGALAQGDPTVRGYPEADVLGEVGTVEESTPSQQPQPTRAAQPEAQPATQAAPATAPVRAQDTGSSLPFTGLEVGIVALMGAMLLGTGAVLRRTTRRTE